MPFLLQGYIHILSLLQGIASKECHHPHSLHDNMLFHYIDNIMLIEPDKQIGPSTQDALVRQMHARGPATSLTSGNCHICKVFRDSVAWGTPSKLKDKTYCTLYLLPLSKRLST